MNSYCRLGAENSTDSRNPIVINMSSRHLFEFADCVLDARLNSTRDKTLADVPARTFDTNYSAWRPRTPVLDKILGYQGIDQEKFLALVGRWFFDMGDLDDWGVTPALIGLAGTGKSTILNALIKAYPRNKIAILSNLYSKFWVSGIVDCFSWIAPEFKGDDGLIGRLQTPGKITVSKLHGEPFVVDWRAPGIIAGNEMPQDCRGLVIFKFRRFVTTHDSTLDRQLEAEVPHIVVKAIDAYHETLRKFGRRGPVWSK